MRLLAVDGNSIVNRAFYGIRPLTTKDGQFTNAIYGFLTMLYKIKNEENNKSIINLGNGDSYISKNNMGSRKE